jgi:hypothetical protein
MSAFQWFILASLAVWRITHLLQAEDGPWDALVKLRALAGDSFFGKLLDCFYCLSLWTALPFAWLVEGWFHRVVFWLAASAAAILLERATGGLREPPVAPYFEEPKEKSDVL